MVLVTKVGPRLRHQEGIFLFHPFCTSLTMAGEAACGADGQFLVSLVQWFLSLCLSSDTSMTRKGMYTYMYMCSHMYIYTLYIYVYILYIHTQ